MVNSIFVGENNRELESPSLEIVELNLFDASLYIFIDKSVL